MPKKSYAWKDPSGISKVAIVCVSIAGAMHLASLAAWLILQDRAGYVSSQQDLTDSQSLRALLDFGLFISFFTCAPIILWIYRVCSNAHTLSKRMTISPGWAIGWYLVPVASLFQPYESMKEIWVASSGMKEKDIPAAVKQWWLCYIASNILAYASLIGSPSAFWILGSVRDILSLFVVGLIVLIIRNICTMQISRNDMKLIFDEPVSAAEVRDISVALRP